MVFVTLLVVAFASGYFDGESERPVDLFLTKGRLRPDFMPETPPPENAQTPAPVDATLALETQRSSRFDVVSVADLIAVMSGLALVTIGWRFEPFVDQHAPVSPQSLLIAGVVLVVWGFRRLPFLLLGKRVPPRRRTLYRQRVLLPREGLVCVVIMIVLAAGSMIGHSNMLMLVFAMVAGPFVMNGWIMFSMLQRTAASRSVPDRANAGESVSVTVALTNRKFLFSSRLMTVRDRIRNAREDIECNVLFVRVPPRSERRGAYRIRFADRGRYFFGPLYLNSRFPLGLGERGRIFDAPDEILVRPRIGRIATAWKSHALPAPEMSERQHARQGFYDDDFHAIRDYRPGDSPRSVHWKTTARKGRVMVREYRQTRDYHLAILLDLWLPRKPDEDDLQRIELVVSFAATLFVEHARDSRDSRFALFIAGTEFDAVDGILTSNALDIVLDKLALVSGADDTDMERLLDKSAPVRQAGARTILLTTRSESLRTQWLAGEIEPVDAHGAIEILGADTPDMSAAYIPVL